MGPKMGKVPRHTCSKHRWQNDSPNSFAGMANLMPAFATHCVSHIRAFQLDLRLSSASVLPKLDICHAFHERRGRCSVMHWHLSCTPLGSEHVGFARPLAWNRKGRGGFSGESIFNQTCKFGIPTGGALKRKNEFPGLPESQNLKMLVFSFWQPRICVA